IIPFTATSLRQNRLAGQFGLIVGAVGYLVLVVWVFVIAGAVKEGLFRRGPASDPTRARFVRRALVVSTVMLVLAAYAGWRLWLSEDARVSGAVLEPLSVTAKTEGNVLDFVVSDSAWTMRHKPDWLQGRGAVRRADLVEDHGKLVHLFLIDPTGSR